MNDRYTVTYTEKELKELVKNDVHKPKIRFKDIDKLADYVSNIPPIKMFKRINTLILDEGVNPMDIDVFVVNENNEAAMLHLGLPHRFRLVYTDPLSA